MIWIKCNNRLNFRNSWSALDFANNLRFFPAYRYICLFSLSKFWGKFGNKTSLWQGTYNGQRFASVHQASSGLILKYIYEIKKFHEISGKLETKLELKIKTDQKFRGPSRAKFKFLKLITFRLGTSGIIRASSKINL